VKALSTGSDPGATQIETTRTVNIVQKAGIGNSLRFDGSSSYLSRTPTTAGNRETWTWSGWVKRGNIGSNKQGIFSIRDSSNAYYTMLAFFSNQIFFEDTQSSSFVAQNYTTPLFRDSSAWYHIMYVVDTTQATATANERQKLYVNGTRITNNLISNYDQYEDSLWNNTSTHNTGVFQTSDGTFYFTGYLANIQFIDGQALDPYFFGEFKDNIWVPYNAFSTAGSGTATASDGDTATDSYGTNGFHLDFADSSNIGNDVSGNNNDWTVN